MKPDYWMQRWQENRIGFHEAEPNPRLVENYRALNDTIRALVPLCGKSVDLEITDSGGASGLVGLAGWAGGMEGEREDDEATERTTKQGGRLVHERSAKRPNGRSEYDIVLGDRFIVKADGSGVDLNQLKSAVSSLDLGKLESMKDSGMQK